MTYIALSDEVETRGLILKALALRKKIYVPRLNRSRGEMMAVPIQNLSTELSKGSYGVLEPKRLNSSKRKKATFDLVIVPGVGFDKKGGRLGRGGGHFDRFLKKVKRAKKIGLAFREQIVKKIPMGRTDIRVDRVVTD